MPLRCTCWLLLLLLQLCVCLANHPVEAKRHHQVIVGHDGFHNIHHEPKWKARLEQHAKHHNLITQT